MSIGAAHLTKDATGVAAIAPASAPRALVEDVKDTPEGRVIGSHILSGYSDIYPHLSSDHYVRPTARVIVREMANRCLDIPEAIPSVTAGFGSSANVIEGAGAACARCCYCWASPCSPLSIGFQMRPGADGS